MNENLRKGYSQQNLPSTTNLKLPKSSSKSKDNFFTFKNSPRADLKENFPNFDLEMGSENDLISRASDHYFEEQTPKENKFKHNEKNMKEDFSLKGK